jgi:ABC-type antimicrobial peptide transport system permease subunit
MTTRVEGTLRTPRLLATLIGAFATLALVLSGVGVYGTIAYGVTLRTREFGVRIALGARRNDVLLLVLRGGLRLAGAGLVLGLVITLALGRVTQSLLYSVDVFDAGVLVGVSVLLLAVAAFASVSPAWRASRIEPTEALRWE